VVKRHRELLDIVLTDLRYSTSEVAQLGSYAPNYPQAARSFIEWCRDEVGPLDFDDDGIATRGMIVRILVLPGKESEAIESLKWLANTCGTDTYISVMSQYTPVYKALETPGWNRKLKEDEYARVVDCAESLGFENGWIQEFDTPAPEELLGCNMQPGGASQAIG
jgi:putative pyruvate formate lyase activating enzyme